MWAITLLERVLTRLGREMESDGKRELFEVLRPGLTVEGSGLSHPAVACRLNPSEEAARMAAMRLRMRYRE